MISEDANLMKNGNPIVRIGVKVLIQQRIASMVEGLPYDYLMLIQSCLSKLNL